VDHANPRLVLRQGSQVDPGDRRLNVLTKATHNDLGGTAAGEALRHVNDRLIDGRTSRDDTQLLFAVWSSGEGGGGANFKSLGNR
jgi:hypothetical protein